jgi:MFS transporter, DHA1 family, multidrug resistance protein
LSRHDADDGSPRMSAAPKRPSLAILIAVSAVGPMALNIFIPSMPGMRTVFDADYGTIQLTLTAYIFAIALAQLVLGPLSDRFGRRPVLLAGLVLFVVASLACALATSIELLIALRVLQATGGCAGLVLGRAIVRDLFDQETSASMLGYITMAMVLAPMMAPTMGGFLDDWFGWQAGFVVSAVAGALILAASWGSLHETNFHRRPMPGIGAMARDYGTLLRSRVFVANALAGACAVSIFFSFLAGAPFVMVELLGRTPSEYGLWFMLAAGGYMAGNFLAGRFARRLGTDLLVVAGNALALAAMVVMIAMALAGLFSPVAIFAPMFFSGVANGMVIPNTLANAVSVRPDMAGAASGFAGSLHLVMGGIGTVIVGHAQNDTQWPMLLTMGGFAVLAFASGIYAHRSRMAGAPA